MVMRKTGDILIHLVSEEGRYVCYWRPVDGSSPDIFLCAADADIVSKHPHLRDLFAELAAELALNRGRESGDGRTLRVREPLAKSIAP